MVLLASRMKVEAWSHESPDYLNSASLFSAFASNTTYTVSYSGGTLGSSGGNVVVGNGVFAGSAPYLTGNTFNDLQGMDAGSDMAMTWNARPGGTTNVSVWIEDIVTENDVFIFSENISAGPLPGDLTISADDLDPDTSYLGDLEFARGYNPGDGTSLAGDGVFAFNSLTEYEFTTAPSPVPLPAAAWLFGPGFLGLIGFSRRKKTA